MLEDFGGVIDGAIDPEDPDLDDYLPDQQEDTSQWNNDGITQVDEIEGSNTKVHNDYLKNMEVIHQTMQDSQASLDKYQDELDAFQDYDWEDDQEIDMGEADPWEDEAVMDEDEDKALDSRCEFGEFWNEDTEACETIEGGYTDDEFNFDEGLTEDEFIEEELKELDDTFSESDLEEI